MAKQRDDGIGFDVTCAASRHAELIADELIEHGDCPQLADEAKLCGESIRSAVQSLYRARAEIKRLTAEVERHRMTDEERAVLLGVAFTACKSLSQWAVVEDYLARTATREEE